MLLEIRPTFWINPLHITNVWVDSLDLSKLKFQLSSDGSDEYNILSDPKEIGIFCSYTGFRMPNVPDQPQAPAGRS